ncbi:MAG: LEA type 2 family protein [Spirochaetota bacterium]
MKRALLLAAVTLVVFGGCETLRWLGIAVERPSARLERVSLARLNFDEAELAAEFTVENPNAVGITLTGFSWELEIEGERFLAGDQSRGVAIDAFGESSFDVPISFRFENLFATYDAVREQDEVAYTLRLELRFELPILGVVTIPLREEGTFPVVRPPSVRVAELRVDSISITGARLTLVVDVENPNGFGVTLDSLDYAFAVQDRVWVDGATDRSRSIAANASGEIAAGFQLSFTAFGLTLRDLLLGAETIDYTFNAQAVISPDLDLVPTLTLPVTRQGRVDLRRP